MDAVEFVMPMVLGVISTAAIMRQEVHGALASVFSGKCVSCGYDLSGLDDRTRCPECGRARAGWTERWHFEWEVRYRRVWLSVAAFVLCLLVSLLPLALWSGLYYFGGYSARMDVVVLGRGDNWRTCLSASDLMGIPGFMMALCALRAHALSRAEAGACVIRTSAVGAAAQCAVVLLGWLADCVHLSKAMQPFAGLAIFGWVVLSVITTGVMILEQIDALRRYIRRRLRVKNSFEEGFGAVDVPRENAAVSRSPQ